MLRRRRGQPVRDLVRESVSFERGDAAMVDGERVALVAHWSAHPQTTRSMSMLVAELQAFGYQVAVSSACESRTPLGWLPEVDVDRLVVLRRRNLGYDFGSWSVAIDQLPGAAQARRTLLINDSMAGPFTSFAGLLEQFDDAPTDVWALTDTRQFGPHLQSYCLGFGPGVLAEGPVRDFWAGIRHHEDKQQIIMQNEVGFSALLRTEGYSHAPAIAHELVVAPGLNPVISGWRNLLDRGFPFVKRELLRDPAVAPGGRTAPAVVRDRFGVDVWDWIEDRAA